MISWEPDNPTVVSRALTRIGNVDVGRGLADAIYSGG